ncbi:MAG: hypothetical protein ACMXYF_01305 [Candidatus Woesearchaeota archaeon]
MVGWSLAVGWLVFLITIVVSIILVTTMRKWYPVLYVVSVSLYLFTMSFIIDAFSLGRNGILSILGISAVIMMGLGLYLSKKMKK